MTDLVPTEDIELIVGATRHPTLHIAWAVSAEQTVYILHSRECLDSGIDLRECRFSVALDNGIESADWSQVEDRPLYVVTEDGFLWPDDEAPSPLQEPLYRVWEDDPDA